MKWIKMVDREQNECGFKAEPWHQFVASFGMMNLEITNVIFINMDG